MYTGVYWPKDNPVADDFGHWWFERDFTATLNRQSVVEPPSYCVRLLVFRYEDCL